MARLRPCALASCSKTFTKEGASSPDDADALPPRTTRCPITPSGLAPLREELTHLKRAGGSELAQRRARVISQAPESIDVMEPLAPDGRVAFGARITLKDASGQEIAYEIVGLDEVDSTAGG